MPSRRSDRDIGCSPAWPAASGGRGSAAPSSRKQGSAATGPCPSVAVAPDGTVVLESTETLSLVTLERAAVQRARKEYPGYLATRPELYARAWEEAGRAMAIEAAAADDDTDDDAPSVPYSSTQP